MHLLTHHPRAAEDAAPFLRPLPGVPPDAPMLAALGLPSQLDAALVLGALAPMPDRAVKLTLVGMRRVYAFLASEMKDREVRLRRACWSMLRKGRGFRVCRADYVGLIAPWWSASCPCREGSAASLQGAREAIVAAFQGRSPLIWLPGAGSGPPPHVSFTASCTTRSSPSR